MAAEMKSGNIFAMVFEDNQHMIGAAIIGREKNINAANLISLYLLPAKIGHGFGHAFYSDMETELENRGFSKCVLSVLADNKRAIRFYETHGFINTGETIKATLGDCDYPCSVYEKRLGK